MSRIIEHIGTVERVEGDVVTVKIAAQSACGSCRARTACGMGESQEKMMEIRTPDAAAYSAGEQVTVGVRSDAAGLAVVLGYAGALAVLIVALTVCTQVCGLSDGAAALWSAGSVAAYYVVLWLCRGRIDKRINFTISKR